MSHQQGASRGDQLDEARKKALLESLQNIVEEDEGELQGYLGRMVIKRNRTSLMMNSFMHNIVDIENSVETTKEYLK